MQSYVLRVPFERFLELCCNLCPLIFTCAQRDLLGARFMQIGFQGKGLCEGIASLLVLFVLLVSCPEIKVATGVLRGFLGRRLQDGQRLCRLTLGHERLPQKFIGGPILRMELENVLCRRHSWSGACDRNASSASRIWLSETWRVRLCEGELGLPQFLVFDVRLTEIIVRQRQARRLFDGVAAREE